MSQSYFAVIFRVALLLILILPFNFMANGKLTNQLAMLNCNLHISDRALAKTKEDARIVRLTKMERSGTERFLCNTTSDQNEDEFHVGACISPNATI